MIYLKNVSNGTNAFLIVQLQFNCVFYHRINTKIIYAYYLFLPPLPLIAIPLLLHLTT